ncbi:hypothetical protein C439_00010 [Haloferax mediterranei ATCC 33500]|nr:hypothetical protein BM92_17795 [Haloferax mediterranei ATCC 33500]EMA05135.1 hypothetical protein C439_00010 [Haloferax mediterranei ATCC 33500]
MEGTGTLFEEGKLTDVEEDWGANGVTLSATLSVEQPDPIEIGGFDVSVGKPDAGAVEFDFSLTFDSEPLFAAISVILLAKGVITVKDVERTADKLGIDSNALNLQQNPEYFHDINSLGHVRAEFGLPEVHLLLPGEHLRVGRRVTQNGNTVGIEPVADDPRPTTKLVNPTVVADTKDGASISVGGPQDVTLPPLLVRGSGIALEFEEVAPDFSSTSGHPSVTEMDGYDASWQGLYVGETTVWGLDELLPFLPDELDSSNADGGSGNGGGNGSGANGGNGSNNGGSTSAGGSRLTFSEWLIDENGATGSVSFVVPPASSRDELLQLRKLTLGFDRGWVPTTLAADVALDFSTLSNDDGDDLGGLGNDGTLLLGTDLRYDPSPEAPPARFGFDFVVRGGDDDAFLHLGTGALGSAAPVVFAVMAGLTAPLDTELGVVMASMAALEARGDLETKRIAIKELSFSYAPEKRTANGTDYWARVLTVSVSTSVESQLQLDAADIDTPLGLGLNDLTLTWVLNHGELQKAGATKQPNPVAVSWELDDISVTLSANANLANVVTITDVSLRKTDEEFLIELGVEASGSGDVAIGGLPDAVVLAFDAKKPDVGDFKGVRLKQGGQPITILAPGTLYASGEMTTGKDAISQFPEPAQGTWESGMVGSLQAFVVGNGTAKKPADHRKRSSYQFTFDIDLLSAQSSGGMTTLVVTIDGTFTPGIPLGTSGAALYGLGLLYAQNAQPALPQDGDLPEWYMNESPQYTTDAPKWEPALDEWGFGASVVLGSAPDEARSWSAKAGLFLMLPGPVIMIAGKADMFSGKPSMGGGSSPPFAAVIVLDFEDDVFSIDIKADLSLPEDSDADLVELDVPVELFVDLQNAEQFYLYFGRYQPKEKRVTALALGMLDISSYLMLDGRTIAGLPMGDLPGLALALGGEARVKWGLDADVIQCYLYAEAAFHLGVSLADPPLLVGMVRIEGGLVVKVFGFGPELGVYAQLSAVAPEPFELTGEVGVDIDLPWPLSDVHTSVDFTFGPGGDLPDAPDPIEGVTAHSRYEKKAQELSENGNNDRVPVDPVFTVAFDAPVGNESGTVGSFNTGGDDTNHPVWKVVSSSEEKDENGIKKRHRVGYRYELVDVSITEVREDGSNQTLSDKPATWDPKATSGGNTEAGRNAGATSSGGMPARNALQLLDAEKSHTSKYVGTAAKLVRETEASWDPCRREKPKQSATYHAADMPTGPLDEEADELTPIDDESPPAYGRAEPQTNAGRSLQRYADFDVLPAAVHERAWSKAAAPTPAFERRRFLCVPQAVGRSDHSNRLLASLETRPCEALDVAVPENDEVTIRLLLAPNVKLTAQPMSDGEVDGEPLKAEWVEPLYSDRDPVGPSHDATREGWGIYEVTATSGIDVVRLWAVRAASGFVQESLEPFTATVLDVTADLPGQRGSSPNVEVDAMNDLYSDLLNAKYSGTAPGVLKPDTEYEISVKVKATHAEQWGESDPEFSDAAGTHSRTWTVRTEAEPRERLRATDDPDGSKDNWDVATRPRDGAPAFYRGSDVELAFRRERTLAAFEAHGTALAVRLVDEQGNDQFDAVDVTEKLASDLPPTAAEWREMLSNIGCLNIDPMELYASGEDTIESILEPGARYVASIHVVDANTKLKNVNFDDESTAPAVHSWRFTASRYLDAGEHLGAHEPVDELVASAPDEQALQSLAATKTQATGVTVDDEALDTLLHGDVGLSPRRAPDDPEVVRIWRWKPSSDTADPLALLFDGPEPLAREGYDLSVKQNGRELNGRFLTRTDRARVLFVPDAGELAANADCTVEVDHSGATERTTVAIPKRPAQLQPMGVIP